MQTKIEIRDPKYPDAAGLITHELAVTHDYGLGQSSTNVEGLTDAGLDALLRAVLDRVEITPALVLELATSLKTGGQWDEVRSRLDMLNDIQSVSGYPEGAVIIAGGEQIPTSTYRLSLYGDELDERYGVFETFDDALDHLRIALDDEMILNLGDVPVTYVDMRTGLKVELGRADQLDDMREPTATKQSNGWTWDARVGAWFAVVDGERVENWATYNDPPQRAPRGVNVR